MSAAIHLSTLSEDADDDARSILDSSTLTVKVTVSPRFSFPVGPRDRMSLSEKGMRSASSGADTWPLLLRVPDCFTRWTVPVTVPWGRSTFFATGTGSGGCSVSFSRNFEKPW